MLNTLVHETESEDLSPSNALATLPHKSKLYTKLAPLYESLFPFLGWQVDKGLRWHPIKPGQEVLEIGVGTGFSLRHYPPQSKVTGIDISGEMLTGAQRKIDANKWNHIKLLNMSALDIALPDNSFDCVMAFHVISVVPDPVRMMREVQRVCKPNGTLLLINHFCGEAGVGEGLGRLMDPVARRLGWRTTLKASQIFDGTTFTVESARRTHWVSPYWVILAKNRKR